MSVTVDKDIVWVLVVIVVVISSVIVDSLNSFSGDGRFVSFHSLDLL